MVSTAKTNMAYLESLLTITRIILHLDEEGSFAMKSIEIERVVQKPGVI